MAYPSPLYVGKKDETYLTITGAKYRAKETVSGVKTGATYRNDPVAIANMRDATDGSTTVQNLTQYVANSDLCTVTDPHILSTDVDYFVYYDSPSIVLSCTTVSASNSLTVPTGATFIVGMGVAGTGIPTGAVIASVTDATHVLLSQPMTASATVNVTFTGNVVGSVEVDNWASESADIPAYL